MNESNDSSHNDDIIKTNQNENYNPSGICLVRSLYLRLLGLTYLFAFLSLYFQIQGLYGDEGIFPTKSFYDRVVTSNSKFNFFDTPVLIYFSDYFKNLYNYFPNLSNFSDIENFLHFLCLFSVIISLLIVLNFSIVNNVFGFFFLWLSYLTFLLIGETFMHFQWDIFVLE